MINRENGREGEERNSEEETKMARTVLRNSVDLAKSFAR
jgi:hypothetical protein